MNEKEQILEVVKNLSIDLSEDHLTIIPSLLWSLMCLDMLEDSELIEKSLGILAEA
jgi:hypothetical protein